MWSLAIIISVFKFSPNVYMHDRCNCSHNSWYPTNMFRQNGRQWQNMNSTFYVPIKEVIWQCKSMWMLWPCDWATYLCQAFSVETFKPRIQKLQCKNAEALCLAKIAWHKECLLPKKVTEQTLSLLHLRCHSSEVWCYDQWVHEMYKQVGGFQDLIILHTWICLVLIPVLFSSWAILH
jgi:hypothetical protein